jgi:hypothetical protein
MTVAIHTMEARSEPIPPPDVATARNADDTVVTTSRGGVAEYGVDRARRRIR